MDIVDKINNKYGGTTRIGIVNLICEFIIIPCKCQWCLRINNEKSNKCYKCNTYICYECYHWNSWYGKICTQCKNQLLDSIQV